MSSCGCGTGLNTPGQRLLFVGYNPDEKFDYGVENKKFYPLAPGDELEVTNCGCKTCGMGIDVVRNCDGVKTMVWSEEVSKLPA